MCRRRGRTVLTTLMATLALLAGAEPGAGQEAPSFQERAEARAAEERALLERIEGMRDALAEARERSLREAARNDSIHEARSAVDLDTVAVGPLRVVSHEDRADEARRAVEAVWSEMEPWIGSDAVPLAEGHFFLYDPRNDLGRVSLPDHYRISGRDWSDFSFTGDMVRSNLRIAIAREVARLSPPMLEAWTSGAGPLRRPDAELPDLYRQLVLTPSIATERCVAGDAAGCWAALGLNVSDQPMTEWYTEAQAGLASNRRKGAWEWFACAAQRPPERCDEPVRARRWTGLIPLAHPLRADFLGFALEQGGEGALERLLDHLPEEAGTRRSRGGDPDVDHAAFAESVRAGLADASGMEGDALVLAWRERLVESRPDVQADAERTRTATFAWIVLFTVLATRSSRWRLG